MDAIHPADQFRQPHKPIRCQLIVSQRRQLQHGDATFRGHQQARRQRQCTSRELRGHQIVQPRSLCQEGPNTASHWACPDERSTLLPSQ